MLVISVQFHVLGHVGARGAEGPVPLGSARQRVVLAALLVEPGTLVTPAQLAERVWGTSPPPSARQTLHSYISRLRSVLGDADGPVPVRRSGGYVLDLDAEAIDLHRFRALVSQARNARDTNAESLWRDALELWQGVPFADLDSDWLRSVALRLQAEHHAATLDYHHLLLRRGEHSRLLPDLTASARAWPLDERVAGQLMLALYRCGRQAEALEHYRQLQELLADELGSDPGPEARELYRRILQHDPVLAVPAVAVGPAGGSGALAGAGAEGAASGGSSGKFDEVRPAQLPLDVAGFTGRADVLRRLDELAVGPDAGVGSVPGAVAARAVVITAIGGTAGVGKTALAVHWAHRAVEGFPDGQLYANLRGYDPEQPVRPSDALARFLSALGVPDRQIPLDVEDRAARFRSLLAGRRMLILLDNAGTVAQVRPLLPGGGSSLVLVTSRDALTGLVALHGAHQVNLDLLPADEAVDLLHRLIGPRVADEPGAAATLVEQCARLPLALRVAAVLATSRPDRSLAEVVAELADRQERLALLDPGGDPYAAVHAVFSWSLQHLPEQAVRAFRRLGLHPGPDLEPYAASALTGLDPSQARRVLDLLVNAHLVHRVGKTRYGMHDLLRAYATRLALADDTDQERRAAEERLLAFYQAAASATMSTLRPAESVHEPDPALPKVPVPALETQQAARDWVEAERHCLLAIAEHAAETGRSAFAVGLARTLHRYLIDAHVSDGLVINAQALRAAESDDDTTGQAQMLRQLGVVHMRLSQYETATDYSERALTLFRQENDPAGEAVTLTNLGSIHYQLGDHQSAMDSHTRALTVSRQVGDRRGEAVALTNIAIIHERRGEFDASIETDLAALAIVRELGLRYTQAVTLKQSRDI
ncbi:BTAD domain-containing putative transcriptional regulator [Promicromonospora sp. NPDC057488]|uniref:AfsR/SARP family transcriptional regulator n=1 Tax=Promicromonospora sp. NPDC057488 TaxID=3346147 RepID=UPI003672FB75